MTNNNEWDKAAPSLPAFFELPCCESGQSQFMHRRACLNIHLDFMRTEQEAVAASEEIIAVEQDIIAATKAEQSELESVSRHRLWEQYES